MNKLEKVREKARRLGIKEEIKTSTAKDKKYMIKHSGKLIHFGHKSYEDYLDHNDKKRRENYQKRARGIRDKKGNLTYKDKSSPNYYSYWLLW